jgi:hypothetical protein
MSMLTNAPLWLLAMLAMVGLGLLGTGIQRDRKPLRSWGFGLILLALVLGVVRWTVPTDEKRVLQKAKDLVAAVSDRKWSAVHQMLRHTSMMGWEGDRLADETQRIASQYQLLNVGISTISIKRESDVYIVAMSVVSHHNSEVYDTVPSTWHLEYEKRLEGWVLISITPIRIGTADSGEAEQLLRNR